MLPTAVLNGIIDAQNKYQKWTCDNSWAGYAPEYLLTCSIAESIANTNKYAIALEANVAYIMKEAGWSKRGPCPSILRPNGRFDIVAYDTEQKIPSSVIEVKSPVGSYSQIEDDILRLSNIVSLSLSAKNKNCATGIMACYSWEDTNRIVATEKLSNKYESLFESIKNEITHYNDLTLTSKFKIGDLDEEGYAWMATVFVIS